MGIAGITDEEKEQRRLRAMDLRLKGWSYRRIAAELGVSVGQAYDDVLHEVRVRARQLKERAEDVRQMEVARMDKILETIWDRIEGGSLDHIDSYLKIAARRAKLLGLDAAKETKVRIEDETNPRGLSDKQLYDRLRALHDRLARAGARQPHPILFERSPFEALPEPTTIDAEPVRVENNGKKPGPGDAFSSEKTPAQQPDIQFSKNGEQTEGPEGPPDPATAT